MSALLGIGMTGVGMLGGAMAQGAKNKRLDAIMEGADPYRKGMERRYGSEQDALIQALARGGADQSMAQADVARSDLGRQLRAAEASGGARAAMFTGQEAELGGKIGGAAGQESVANYGGAANNIVQAQQDSLRRRAIALRAQQMYEAAKAERKSAISGAISGGSNALLGYLKGNG